MQQAEGSGRRMRRWRSVSEKRQIVQQTMEPGASVALVARAHGMNANQLFKWRRSFERGELADLAASPQALLPVTVAVPSAPEIREAASEQHPGRSGSIHIEFPGRAVISIERGADPRLLHSVLESLRK
jgi:transposase